MAAIKAGDRIGLVGKERRCDICGKDIIIHSDWAFRKGTPDRGYVFCSWSCLRKWESRRRKKAERREDILKALRSGMTVGETVKALNEDYNKVRYWKKKLEEGTA